MEVQRFMKATSRSGSTLVTGAAATLKANGVDSSGVLPPQHEVELGRKNLGGETPSSS